MCLRLSSNMGFIGGSVVKNAGDVETQVQSLRVKIPWRRKMATHSNILAWEISWTEESGGPQSMESQNKWT